mmetsp:Transcript_38363/g.106890  ORF Transcript_38363/g.106890 Transcript_38363/m.106890 type:complete len:206 (+) Transcript_38363:52-669(+)
MLHWLLCMLVQSNMNCLRAIIRHLDPPIPGYTSVLVDVTFVRNSFGGKIIMLAINRLRWPAVQEPALDTPTVAEVLPTCPLAPRLLRLTLDAASALSNPLDSSFVCIRSVTHAEANPRKQPQELLHRVNAFHTRWLKGVEHHNALNANSLTTPGRDLLKDTVDECEERTPLCMAAWGARSRGWEHCKAGVIVLCWGCRGAKDFTV